MASEPASTTTPPAPRPCDDPARIPDCWRRPSLADLREAAEAATAAAVASPSADAHRSAARAWNAVLGHLRNYPLRDGGQAAREAGGAPGRAPRGGQVGGRPMSGAGEGREIAGVLVQCRVCLATWREGNPERCECLHPDKSKWGRTPWWFPADAGASTDDELVAAFLDGRLSEADRAALLERLAKEPELYELLVSTAGLLLEAEDARTAAFRALAAHLNASRDRLAKPLSIMVERAMHGETPKPEETEAARAALADVGYRRTWDRREDTTPPPPEGEGTGTEVAHG